MSGQINPAYQRITADALITELEVRSGAKLREATAATYKNPEIEIYKKDGDIFLLNGDGNAYKLQGLGWVKDEFVKANSIQESPKPNPEAQYKQGGIEDLICAFPHWNQEQTRTTYKDWNFYVKGDEVLLAGDKTIYRFDKSEGKWIKDEDATKVLRPSKPDAKQAPAQELLSKTDVAAENLRAEENSKAQLVLDAKQWFDNWKANTLSVVKSIDEESKFQIPEGVRSLEMKFANGVPIKWTRGEETKNGTVLEIDKDGKMILKGETEEIDIIKAEFQDASTRKKPYAGFFRRSVVQQTAKEALVKEAEKGSRLLFQGDDKGFGVGVPRGMTKGITRVLVDGVEQVLDRGPYSLRFGDFTYSYDYDRIAAPSLSSELPSQIILEYGEGAVEINLKKI